MISATPAARPSEKTHTIAGLLTEGRRTLRHLSHADAGLEAEILLCLTLSKRREYLFSWPDMTVSGTGVKRYRSCLHRRADGWPIAYLTGQREFWSLSLQVDRHTLIPRHETETLVEVVLNRLAAGRSARVADIGCGCGAIAFAIAHARPHCDVSATDHCEKALRTAKANLKTLALSNVTFFTGDWLHPLSGQRFDWIVSNPPYLSASDPHLTRDDLRFEPRQALVSDSEDGTACLRKLIRDAPSFLVANGILALEHGCNQGEAVRRCFAHHRYRKVETYQDLSGHERVTLGVAPVVHDD